jgi:hypothetical protein
MTRRRVNLMLMFVSLFLRVGIHWEPANLWRASVGVKRIGEAFSYSFSPLIV